MNNTHDNHGFTLIEALVASLLTLILAGGVISIFSLYTSDARQLTSHITLQKQYETVVEQIGLKVRNSDSLAVGATLLSGNRTKSIRVLRNGAQIYEFSIGNPDQTSDTVFLYEDFSSNGGSPVPFKTGGQTIQLVSPVLIRASDGNSVTFSFRLTNGTDTIPVRQERFRCRN